jgi:polyhydroxybutyrate depolymerase
MRSRGNGPLRSPLVALTVALLLSCSANDTNTPATTSGVTTGGTGTGGAATGGVSTGGTSTGGSHTGGTGTGGASTGGASFGGTSTGGTSTGGAKGGGMSSGGSAGKAGTGGSSAGGGAGGAAGGSVGSGGSGSSGTPTPSAGCSKGSKGTRIAKTNEEIVDFPSSYDGAKPFPLLMMLHACGNPNDQFEQLVSKRGATNIADEYVRWMPNTTAASGQCWSNYANDVKRILAQYDELVANYCIDTSRVFGTGHSSGAQMLVNILSHKSDADHLKIKGVAPVSADPYNVAMPVPVMYIDGENDTVRGAQSAPNTVAKFRSANMCAETTKDYTAVMGCKSYQNQAQVDPGCKIYDGCVVPTIWCAHNDPDYSNTQHGVPCFAFPAMYDFFKSL